MKSVFNIFLLIFCLGIFVLPKQEAYAQNFETEECCQSSSEKSDCCNDDDKNSENHCTDNCCSACHTCSSCLSFAIAKVEKYSPEFKNNFFKKSNFIYKSPSFSLYLKEIWQPPKLG